jgi:hypothetical protein
MRREGEDRPCAGPPFSCQGWRSLPGGPEYVIQTAFQSIHDLLEPAQSDRLLTVL